MLFRASCSCGREFLVSKYDVGTHMTCAACQRSIAIPMNPPEVADEESPEPEVRSSMAGGSQPDPLSAEEQEYQRRYSPAARARRAAARKPMPVRLRGILWLAAGVALVPLLHWLAIQIKAPGIPFVRRGPGLVGVCGVIVLGKDMVEIVTGVRLLDLVRRGDDPMLGWREFGTWLLLLAMLVLALAMFFALDLAWTELLARREASGANESQLGWAWRLQSVATSAIAFKAPGRRRACRPGRFESWPRHARRRSRR
jgi:hypothetical protein